MQYQGKPPRWFDRLMCGLAWLALIFFMHCAMKQDWTFPTNYEDVPVTAPGGYRQD
jgi:hypothetical protein